MTNRIYEPWPRAGTRLLYAYRLDPPSELQDMADRPSYYQVFPHYITSSEITLFIFCPFSA